MPPVPFATGEAAQLRIVSLDGRGTDRAPSFEMPLAELLPAGQPLPLVEARAMFADDTARRQGSWPQPCQCTDSIDRKLVTAPSGCVSMHDVPAPAEDLVAAADVQSARSCSWAAYIAGTLLVLMHECGARVPPGMSLCALVASDVPPGAGMSSSAALEVASMAAFATALQLDVPPRLLAILCQMVCL